jgi:hypothetical protein
MLGIMIVAAITAASVGLAEGVIALTRSAPRATAQAPTSETTTASADAKAADLALCTAIAPLMTQFDQFSSSYVHLGKPGTPARDEATPNFVTDSQNWIGHAQPILDQHRDASAFLQRSLQRFLDDRSLLVADLTPGPLSTYATRLWADETGSYSGPLHTCDQLGVKW